MRIKIREILLVSSIYDNYIFEEDGRLYELIRQEYQDLNLSQSPEITHVTTGKEAIELALNEDTFDLIITTLHVEDMHVIQLAQMVRKAGIDIPIILLAYDNLEKQELIANYDTSILERIFIWQGDYHLLIGIIKYVEDRLNIEHDTFSAGVQSIILVEDNVKFYSSYLPLIYTEIFKQSQRLISEGINLTHKFLRMRARPKILLCTTYEEAESYFEKYKEFILGVITDINFKHNGVRDPEAGLKFTKHVKSYREDIPILLQSGNLDFKKRANEVGVSFLYKESPRLLHDLRKFMLNNFGFGDFVFQMEDGTEVARANNLKSLEEKIRTIPDESLLHHCEGNQYSKWLKARTEFYLAHKLRPIKVSDFKDASDLRSNLLNALKDYLDFRQQGIITDFDIETFDPKYSFSRIGGGVLGGKARGLGFINSLIYNYGLKNKFEGIEIIVPSAIVLATDIFDQFMEMNQLENFAINETEDIEIAKKFINAKQFPLEITEKLSFFLQSVKTPLAVRSSSLLEDSQFQPFAGVYQTYMISNSSNDLETRIKELLNAIKAVYASTYYKKAKDYLEATSYRLEEEKMAVIIQRLVGSSHKERFYPNLSGVAKSYNYYPIPPQKSSDGIADVALGLGKIVVDGGNSVKFCPKYPKHLLQFYSAIETLKNAQKEFYALDTKSESNYFQNANEDSLLKKYELDTAEEDGTLYNVGSTYSPENNVVYDGISRRGMRVVTLAPILKHNTFPLDKIIDTILNLGSWGMGAAIEIEFAVNFDVPKGKLKEFSMLQMRPLVVNSEQEQVTISDIKEEDIICRSSQVLGNGLNDNIYDIIFVDKNKFERSNSKETALEINDFNKKLLKKNRPYLLIGMGRWGTLDPWLGIPVTWDQISGVGTIVESVFKDLSVTPSQGTHFFHNLTSNRVGYFTINPFIKLGTINWEWLYKQKPVEEKLFTKHLQFKKPLLIKINGQQNEGVILKPF
ncbi:MAG TPA: histidine kinase [Ignavibacteria bacterium]|nr:histidine kinase [Ignavibacteria bacterium]